MTKSSWRHINTDMARGIKRLIWAGYIQTRVAGLYGVSQTSISRIVNGEDFYDVAWPDGSTGELNPLRRRALKGLRHNLMHLPGSPEEVDDDAGVTEIVRSSLAKALAESHSRDDDERLREALAMVAEGEVTEKVQTGDAVEEETPRIPFTMILEKARKNRLVVAALKKPKKQKALELVFANIPMDQWDSEMAEKLVKDIERKI